MSRLADDDRDDDAPESRGTVSDMLDLLSRRIGGAIVLAGALIGIGLYAGSGRGGSEAPRYQAFSADGEVFRLNTDSGSIIACNANRCMQILRRGQDLAEDQGNTLFKVAPAAQAPATALPAPAQPQPAPAAQPK